MLIISQLAQVSPLADIEESVRGTNITIADHVMIDAFVKIKPAGGSGDVVVGRGTAINSGTVIYTGNGVTIGEDVAIAANCTFAPTNHALARDQRIVDQGFLPSRGGILVEDDVWIGANVVLLDGAILRQGCVIGAGAVVRGEMPPYSINYGVPATTQGYRQ